MVKNILNSKLFQLLWVAKWLLFAYFEILTADSTEWFFSFLIFTWAFFEGVWCLIRLIRKIFLKRSVVFVLLNLLGIFLYLQTLSYTGEIGNQKIEESKLIGDKFIEIIEQEKSTNGYYPKNYDEIPEAAKKLKPTLRGSEFNYQYDNSEGGYYVSFLSTVWIYCSRTEKEREWRCD